MDCRKELEMGQILYFEIPDDSEVMVRLVESVPSKWSWIDGSLHASDALVASGVVAGKTGFELSRFHTIHPTIVGSSKMKADLYAIMVEQKLPAFIRFNEAGYGGEPVTMELSKKVIMAFLRKGYRGWLHFSAGCYDNNKDQNPARCDFAFEKWEGAPFQREESGKQPARLKLGWTEEYCGKARDIEPILSLCRTLNLRQYGPVPDCALVS